MSEVFVTLFDAGYLHHGLALHASLTPAVPGCRLLAVTMEPRAAALLRAMPRPGLEVIEIEQLGDPDLESLRSTRSRAAYCWTATPSALIYALKRAGVGGHATYLDADLAILRSPLAVIEQAQANGAAILATPHACGAVRQALFGRYCVQFLTAWDDASAWSVLHRWRNGVLAACSETPWPGRYGDQCHLDGWPRLLGKRLAEPSDPLLFAAPWNACAGPRASVTFHFHQWRLRSPRAWRWVRNHRLPDWTMPLYRDYQTALESQCRAILATDPAWRPAGIAIDAGPLARAKTALRRRLGWERDGSITDPDLIRALEPG